MIPYRPEDTAPPGDPVHDCDGDYFSEDGPPPERPPIQGAADSASRGWGSGWPRCQTSKIVTLVRSDGMKIGVRRETAQLFAILMDETEQLGYDLIVGWCWGFACRAIRGSSRPSNHSWGLAVDLNAPENPMGPRNGKIRKHPKVIALWRRFGFRWGGDYSGRADDMHMEFLGTPADAKRFIVLARAEFVDHEEVEAVFRKVGSSVYQYVSIPGTGLRRVNIGKGEAGSKALRALESAGVKVPTAKKTDAIVRDVPEATA